MNRRRFVRTLGSSSVAMMLGLRGTRLWAQQSPPQKELPINCAPPSHGSPRPIRFDPSAPIKPRKSAWDLSQMELDRLNAAYQALRNLTTTDPNDPRGWMQQANVHCFNCSGGYDPSNVEIHGSWWFLPWHRCYLHVHERILGKLINDPTFRLPYWDWDTYPTHATLPPPYVPPGSLYDAYRGVTPTDVIPTDITGPAAMSNVLNIRSTSGFMGKLSHPSANKYYPGALENSPHGPVHLWSGWGGSVGGTDPKPVGCWYPNTAGGTPVDQSNNGCMDMGVLATAAQDPIFFTHHANIDRTWDQWLRMPHSQGNPTASSWKSQRFNFYDENSEWISISIADVLDENEQKNLRYFYEPPTAAPPVMLESAPEEVPRRRTTLRSLQPLVVDGDEAQTAVGTAPHTRAVAIPAEHKSNLGTFAAARGRASRRYVLHIDGFTLPPSEGTIVKVFVNEPNPATATSYSGSFVGIFSVVPSGPQHNHAVVRDAEFEIRPATAARISMADELTVSIVPVLPNGQPPQRSSLTYQKIYLSVE